MESKALLCRLLGSSASQFNMCAWQTLLINKRATWQALGDTVATLYNGQRV